MMGEKFENMDGVFRSQLRNYSQTAPSDIWENVEQQLSSQQVTKKYIFYKVAAAVAAIAIIGSGFLYFSNNKQSLNNDSLIVKNTQQQIEENKIINPEREESEIEKVVKQKVVVSVQENQKLIAKTESKLSFNNVIVKKEVKVEERKSFEKLTLKQISFTYQNVSLAIIDIREQNVKTYLNTLPDLYSSYALNDVADYKDSKESKWIIGGEFTPLYSYRHITETNGAYSKDVYNSTENALMSYTGGLNLQYNTSGRLTVQAGVYYTTMGQSLDYMTVYSNVAYDMVAEEYKDRFVNSYSLENSSGDVSFNSQYVIVDEKSVRVNNLSDSKGVADLSDPMYNNLDAEIQQSFKYVEVPVLVRYKLIDKNIDFNLIGGLGANFLVGNDVYLKYSDNKEVIGETSGVSSVNYNGTLGFGIEYPLMDRIKIRLEPSVKYYLNEINSSSSVESHPYSVGIYTGINYSF